MYRGGQHWCCGCRLVALTATCGTTCIFHALHWQGASQLCCDWAPVRHGCKRSLVLAPIICWSFDGTIQHSQELHAALLCVLPCSHVSRHPSHPSQGPVSNLHFAGSCRLRTMSQSLHLPNCPLYLPGVACRHTGGGPGDVDPGRSGSGPWLPAF